MLSFISSFHSVFSAEEIYINSYGRILTFVFPFSHDTRTRMNQLLLYISEETILKCSFLSFDSRLRTLFAMRRKLFEYIYIQISISILLLLQEA